MTSKAEKIKIQLGYMVCDGQFYVSTGLVYRTQLWTQTPDAAMKIFCRCRQTSTTDSE